MLSIINYILTDPVIVPYGAVILAVHVLLCLIFRYLCPDGPWKKLPSFTAHQVIAFVFMIYQTYLGLKYYHIHGIFNINEGGLYMAEFSMASMLMWDIPVGLVSDGMGDPIMHLHHIGFFLVASICLGLFSDGVPIGSAYGTCGCKKAETTRKLVGKNEDSHTHCKCSPILFWPYRNVKYSSHHRGR